MTRLDADGNDLDSIVLTDEEQERDKKAEDYANSRVFMFEAQGFFDTWVPRFEAWASDRTNIEKWPEDELDDLLDATINAIAVLEQVKQDVIARQKDGAA